MSLEKMLKKIEGDAREEVELIIQDSRRKADLIVDAARKEGVTLAESLIQESQRTSQLEASRIVTQAKLEKKIDILTCKKELISFVFERAFQKEISQRKEIKRIVVKKDTESEMVLDEQQLKNRLRPQLEKFIADALNL